jgi:hypothetical protein
MYEVSTFRLNLLRAAYLLVAVGLGIFIWPLLIHTPVSVEHMRGVVRALLGAVGVLALFGIRYPLQMLPILIFELLWKSIWLVVIGLPTRAAGAFTPGTLATWNECLVGVAVCAIVIPWGYVYATYVRGPGDRSDLQPFDVLRHPNR